MRLLPGIAASLVVLFVRPCAAQDDAKELAAIKDEIAELRKKILTGVQQEGQRRLLPQGYTATSALGVTEAYSNKVLGMLKDSVRADVKDVTVAEDSIFLILCGAITFFMHPGFAMYESGACRAKNAQNVLLCMGLNICCGSIAWWIMGFGFAYGGPLDSRGRLRSGGFIGYKDFAGGSFLNEDSNGNMVGYTADANGNATQSKMLLWFYKWAVCTVVGAIASGGIVSRINIWAFTVYATMQALFIWPLVVAWTWGNGWMAGVDIGEGEHLPFTDFGGSAVVHIVGGMGAIVGSFIIGARKGRFDPANAADFFPHSLPLLCFGAFALWFGWYGLNMGAALGLSNSTQGALVAQVASNTTIAAATGGIVSFIVRFVKEGIYDVKAMCHGIIAGLVSISAGCGNVENGSALFIGIIAGFIYEAGTRWLMWMQIDDPCDAGSVHGACGMWGTVAAAIFDWGNAFNHYHGPNGFNCLPKSGPPDAGCRTGIGGIAIGVNIALVIVIALWSGFIAWFVFYFTFKGGFLRISEDAEKEGNDATYHLPPRAYDFGPGHKSVSPQPDNTSKPPEDTEVI